MAITPWLHYADHPLAPICRSRRGSNMAVGDKDPDYRPELLRYGVCPDGVEDYLPDAIGMLIPEREPATA